MPDATGTYEDPFELGENAPQAGEPDALVIDVDGFEGPLDLLLALARTQKVDLTRISVLALAEQYLAYVERARTLRLELAADYLVMAAWLAYLKSRLLVPEPESEEAGGEAMAGDLAFRLQRLEAMRRKAEELFRRAQLRRDVFPRGAPEPTVVTRQAEWDASLYDLLSAYAARRQRDMATEVRFAKRKVWSLLDARKTLERLVGRFAHWAPLEVVLQGLAATPEERRTVRASAFGASLEMAREGRLALRQTSAFSPLYVRHIADPAAAVTPGPGAAGDRDGAARA